MAVPTLITGYYGMNVPFPGSGRALGVVASAVLIAIVSGLLYSCSAARTGCDPAGAGRTSRAPARRPAPARPAPRRGGSPRGRFRARFSQPELRERPRGSTRCTDVVAAADDQQGRGPDWAGRRRRGRAGRRGRRPRRRRPGRRPRPTSAAAGAGAGAEVADRQARGRPARSPSQSVAATSRSASRPMSKRRWPVRASTAPPPAVSRSNSSGGEAGARWSVAGDEAIAGAVAAAAAAVSEQDDAARCRLGHHHVGEEHDPTNPNDLLGRHRNTVSRRVCGPHVDTASNRGSGPTTRNGARPRPGAEMVRGHRGLDQAGWGAIDSWDATTGSTCTRRASAGMASPPRATPTPPTAKPRTTIMNPSPTTRSVRLKAMTEV